MPDLSLNGGQHLGINNFPASRLALRVPYNGSYGVQAGFALTGYKLRYQIQEIRTNGKIMCISRISLGLGQRQPCCPSRRYNT